MVWKLKFIALVLLGLGLLAPLPRARAGLAISPAYMDVVLDKGRVTAEFAITNNGDAEERYRVVSLNFEFSREGEIRRLPTDPNALASWLVFNPKEFTLPPKARQRIRFTIVPKGDVRPGEYVAGMELESLNTSTATSSDQEGHEMKIRIVSTILVPIFAQSGKIKPNGEAQSARVVAFQGQPAAEVLVKNTGNGRLLVGGEFDVLDQTGQSAAKGQIPKGYIFPNTDRLFMVPLKTDMADGTYTIKAKLTCPQLPNGLAVEGTTEWKKPPPATAPATRPARATSQPATAPAPPDPK